MMQLKSLMWKEWREQQAFLWIGLGLFLFLPALGGLEGLFQWSRRFEVVASPWVVWFGGVLAMLVGVGAVCSDFNGRLEDFWRSRPVGVGRWLIVKYWVGLAVVLLACELPLWVELRFDRDKSALALAAWLPFFWTSVYSVAFLAGCLVRRTAQAAMLGLAGMLLLYFLPVVLPPIGWLNVTEITDSWNTLGQWPIVYRPERPAFAAGMLAVAGVALAFSLIAVIRGWRIESGQKMMYWSVGSTLLILVGSAAFQLGTNLPILDQVDLPRGEKAIMIRMEGTHGFILTQENIRPDGTPIADGEYVEGNTFRHWSRTVDLTPSGIQLGKRMWSMDGEDYSDISPPAHPEIEYFINNSGADEIVVSLEIMNVKNGLAIGILPLWSVNEKETAFAHLHLWQNRLYAVGAYLTILDIADPESPKVILKKPFAFNFGPEQSDLETVYIPLPPVPNLPARERLTLALQGEYTILDRNTLCLFFENSIAAYHLAELTDRMAKFIRIGEYRTGTLERVFGTEYYGGRPKIENGLLYTTAFGAHSFNPHVNVIDTGGSRPMRVIGHFAAPGVQSVYPLPDGRAIVAGTKLWLVGPPPRRGG